MQRRRLGAKLASDECCVAIQVIEECASINQVCICQFLLTHMRSGMVVTREQVLSLSSDRQRGSDSAIQ